MGVPRGFISALQRWYETHGRDLPWRGERDPYRVWLREIMLQQTTVTAVVPYLQRFLQAFPTVESLAAADEMAVLRLWEGLGYYSRARNLHRAARQLMTDFAGTFPGDAEGLEALPGIGRYTAGAIASFAFNHAAPIVEANTLRLHARLLGYE
ncbi:MAG: A/G-specific adenine glycosylase, partial [Planctomycetaceae bacterium]|nr:A/G-specific adenine glycosylase [Planctomycetaceae bacterium]